jgi:hypothetical protein
MATPPPIDPDAVMAGLKLRLLRARAVLDALLEDISRVLQAGSEGPPRRNPDDSFSSFYVPRQEPSPAWGIWLGEIAHNLRSSLDNLATVLVVRNGGVPNSDHKFPIFSLKTDWDGRVAGRYPGKGALAGVSREDFDIIEAAQPFRSGTAASEQPLALLAQINNADKHAALHGAVACLAPVAQHVRSVQPPIPIEILWGHDPLTPLEHGAEMTRYRLLAPVPPQFRVELNWPLAVRFTDHKGRSVGSHVLPELFDAVVELVAYWDEEVRASQA